jgi:hypothetical protein
VWICTVRTTGWEGMDFEATCYSQIEVDFSVFSVGEEGSFCCCPYKCYLAHILRCCKRENPYNSMDFVGTEIEEKIWDCWVL